MPAASAVDSRPRTRGGPSRLRVPYVPGVDGLRAISVTAVLLYHADVSWAPGGFLGVEVFFVISGYLITALLFAEWRNTTRVGLGSFYLRRARRLLPALFLMLAVVALYAVLFLPDEVTKLRGDLVAAVFYVQNWWQVFAGRSYFEQIGRPPLLQHLWSLSVEEQFYLVWPLIFTGLLKVWGRHKGRIVAVILAGSVLSAVLMGALFRPYADPSRIYYGTDTRASGLLLGAALALVWSPWRLSPKVRTEGRIVLDVIGVAALAGIVWYFLQVSEFDQPLYRGGFYLLAVLTCIVIAVTVHPAADLGRVLGWKPLVWIGLRSYGIYLWHWPIFMITRPTLDVPVHGYALTALRFGLTIAAAELSFRFLEMPIRQGALSRHWHRLRESKGATHDVLVRRTVVLGVALGLCGALVAVGMVTARPPAKPAGLDVAVADTLPTTTTAAPVTTLPTVPGQVTTPTTAPVVVPRPFAVGDSVMLGGANAIEAAMPGTLVDAAVSRSFGTVADIVRSMKDQGRLGEVVIVHTGTNGLIDPNRFDQMMQDLSGVHRVVVLNLKVPRRWEQPNNDTIGSIVPRYPNAVLIDWHTIGNQNPGWFYDDGIHLRPDGQRAYAALIKQQT